MIGSETLSKVLDWSDRSTSVLLEMELVVSCLKQAIKIVLAENLLQMVAEVLVLSLAIWGCLPLIQMKFPIEDI